MQSFDHVVLQDHVTNKNHCISITRVPMATKLGRMMTSLDGLLPIMPHDPLITWPCEIRGSLTGGGSARRHVSHHRLLVETVPANEKKWFSCKICEICICQVLRLGLHYVRFAN